MDDVSLVATSSVENSPEERQSYGCTHYKRKSKFVVSKRY